MSYTYTSFDVEKIGDPEYVHKLSLGDTWRHRQDVVETVPCGTINNVAAMSSDVARCLWGHMSLDKCSLEGTRLKCPLFTSYVINCTLKGRSYCYKTEPKWRFYSITENLQSKTSTTLYEPTPLGFWATISWILDIIMLKKCSEYRRDCKPHPYHNSQLQLFE